MTKTTDQLFQEAMRQQLLVAELHRPSAVIEAAKAALSSRDVIGRLHFPSPSLLEQIAGGQKAWSDEMRRISAVFDRPTLEATASVRNFIEEASRAVRTNDIFAGVIGTRSAVDELVEQHRASLRSINEAFGQSLSGYNEALRAIQGFGQQLANEHQLIFEQINGLTNTQILEMAKAFEGFDLAEWEDTAPVEDASAEQLKAFVIRVIEHIVARLNPVSWGAGEYLAIIFFIVQLHGPAITARDRETLQHAATDAHDANEHVKAAEVVIGKLRQAQAADDAYQQQVQSLPQGMVVGRGNVRDKPEGSARQIALLPKDTPVAITGKQGRWLKVIYHDALLNQLAEGWVWRASVSLFDGDESITRAE